MDMPGNDEDFSVSQDEPPPATSPQASGLSVLDWAALIAIVAGGLNSGLIAAVDLDVFGRFLPAGFVTRAVYGLIGLAALHCVVLLFRLGEGGD